MRSRAAWAALLALSLAAAPAALSAAASADPVIVELEVFFCDGDLVCDAEEAWQSCPSDCAAPVPPPPDEEDDEDEGPRHGSGPHEPEGPVVNPEGDSVSSAATPIDDRLFAESVDVHVTGGAVEFSWGIARGESVRILRSETGEFPTSPLSGGIVVYEGSAENFVDEDIEPGRTYRYAVFHGSGGVYGVRNLVLAQSSQAMENAFSGGLTIPHPLLVAIVILGLVAGILVRVLLARKP
jgi:hypothetical protein